MKSVSDIDKYLNALEAANRFSGVILISRSDEEVLLNSYGYADRSWKIRNNINTRFNTASMTKLFTAAAVFRLIDQRLLSLDTKIFDFLDLKESAISPEVNIYHLLTHTSGIADDCEEENGEDYTDFWKDKPNYSVLETADFLPNFIYKKRNFEPGEKSRYCNCSFILLGLIIEKISGMSYREYVKKNIFAALGMEDTDFLRLDGAHDNMAVGYYPVSGSGSEDDTWRTNIYSFPPVGTPDSGAYTTVDDLRIFLEKVRNGDLFSEKLTGEFLSPQVHYKDEDDYIWKYGYVLEFMIDKAGNIVSYRKGGDNRGVCAMMIYYPRTDINFIMLSNIDNAAWEPMRRIDKMILAGHI
jgi:CubicO group peptidase (beta-lactamase class C family)